MTIEGLPHILVVDDDPAHRLMLTTLLADWGYHVLEADGGLVAVHRVQEQPLDAVIMDVRMPDMDGIEATRRIHQYNPALPVIVLTAFSSVPSAVEAIKAGAYDYLTKPLDFDALRLALYRALEHTKLRAENQELREQLARLRLPEIIGKSASMERLVELLALVAPSEATVLITGESGTGKGMVARAIHAN
ncbi:MAG: sigma-54-dependent transcriptional regulator, partial [Desulfosoma sp.]|uniref:sigma-54-dependent transcriptional regulator n=1 Tax=Desulfosoma sp. TaxID=2603217 RepID=UPI0040499D22